MATVSGMTPEKIEELTGAAVVSANIDSATGVLTLTTQSGETINVGSSADAALKRAYPIGAIFLSTNASNPSLTLGIGTWQAWGSGRVPVGVDPTQVEFDAAGKTGGAKEVTLQTTHMPSHDHTMNHNHDPFTTAVDGTHSHPLTLRSADGSSGGPTRGNGTTEVTAATQESSHSHTIDIPNYTGDTGLKGGGNPHNNLQPYITCYMWRRIA